jgi:hypothetical protein
MTAGRAEGLALIVGTAISFVYIRPPSECWWSFKA